MANHQHQWVPVEFQLGTYDERHIKTEPANAPARLQPLELFMREWEQREVQKGATHLRVTKLLCGDCGQIREVDAPEPKPIRKSSSGPIQF